MAPLPRSPLIDPLLQHQLILGRTTRGQRLTVSCNCLPPGTWLAVKYRFAEHEALDIYRAHLAGE